VRALVVEDVLGDDVSSLRSGRRPERQPHRSMWSASDHGGWEGHHELGGAFAHGHIGRPAPFFAGFKAHLDVDPVPGVQVTKALEEVYAAPPAVADRLRGILSGK